MKNKAQEKVLILSYFTIVYNIVEGIASVFFGSTFKAISLIGFGFDSFIESISGAIVIWQTKKGDLTNYHGDPTEARAIKFISYSFFILGAYVLYESVRKLLDHEVPQESWIGIIIAVSSIVVMLGLYFEKRKLGLITHNRALVADSKQTLACIWLSVALLMGLGLQHFFGLWWADTTAGLMIAILLFKEGYFTYKEKHLCEC